MMAWVLGNAHSALALSLTVVPFGIIDTLSAILGRDLPAKLRSRNAILALTDIFMTSSESVIAKDPEIMHGTPVFRGTRVPVKALFDSLEAGETLEEFLQGFPSVTREMAIAALDEARALLSAKP